MFKFNIKNLLKFKRKDELAHSVEDHSTEAKLKTEEASQSVKNTTDDTKKDETKKSSHKKNFPILKFSLIKGHKSVVVIEIGSDWLKVINLEVTPAGKKITKIAMRKVILINEILTRTITEIFDELRIRPDSIITVIPRRLVTTRTLELPSTNSQEISEMINLQAGKQTPYSRDEIIVDYTVIESDKEGYTKVMLVIVRKGIVADHIKILEDAKLKTEKVALSSEGVFGWYLSTQKPFITEKTEPFVILDVDSSYTDFVVIDGNKIIFTRSVSIGMEQLLENTSHSPNITEGDTENRWQGELWLNKFIEEIRRSFGIYKNEDMGPRINKIIISGAGSQITRLKEVLSDELGLSVDTWDQFKNVPMVKKPLLIPVEGNKNISMCSVIGLALNKKASSINLMPQEVQIKRSLEQRARDITTMGVLLICILMVVSGIVFEKMYNKKKYLNQLTKQYLKTEQEATKIEKMKMRIKVIKDRLDARGSAINIIYELYKIVPEEIYVTTVNFEEKKQIILRGFAKEMSNVFKFITTLEDLPYFENVKTKYATRKKIRGKEMTDFEIVCPLEASKE